MSASKLHGLADAQMGELRFLEVGIDPNLGERAHGHEALADLHVVAGIDVAARHHAVDFRYDVAVAQVEIGLVEIVLGLEEFRLGLLLHAGASLMSLA